jgi:hypothetical protein
MSQPDPLAEYVRQTVATDLQPDEVAALVAWYTALSKAVASIPAQDLKRVEPPLHSVPQ